MEFLIVYLAGCGITSYLVVFGEIEIFLVEDDDDGKKRFIATVGVTLFWPIVWAALFIEYMKRR